MPVFRESSRLHRAIPTISVYLLEKIPRELDRSALSPKNLGVAVFRLSGELFMQLITLGLVLVLTYPSLQEKPSPPQLREIDRVRLAEAFRLADAIGDKIWPGWNKAAFAVLLVTPEWEFLLRHSQPTKDFTLLGEDQLLQTKVWYRKRTQRVDFLATFPAVGMTPTIVIGQAENTAAKTSTPWVVTLLHEHFHQLQWHDPRYLLDVGNLNLARGDQTGMWMLNYPFPYKDAAVNKQYAALCQALHAALLARGKPDFSEKLTAFLQERRRFQGLLQPDDYKYFTFQLWQEGIARYTEWHVATLAAKTYTPSKEFQALPDYTPFSQVADKHWQKIETALQKPQLERHQREVCYPFGAAEGLLLDAAQPKWRERYFTEKFFLDKYYRPLK
jgi:hypothetical protein